MEYNTQQPQIEALKVITITNTNTNTNTVCTDIESSAQCNATSVSNTNTIDFTTPLPLLNYTKELDIEIKSSKPLSGKQYLLLIPITKFFKKYRNIYLLINILNGRSIISLRLIEYFVVNYVLENNTHYNLTKYKNKPEFIVDNLFTAGPPTIDITSESMVPVNVESPSLKDEIRMSILENKVKANLQVTVPMAQAVADTTTNNFDDYFLVHDNYKCQLKEYNKKNFDPFCRWTRIRMYYDKTKFFYTTVAQLNFFKWAIENYVLDYILDNLVMIEKAMNDYERAIKKEKKIRKLNMLQSTNTINTDIESSDQCNATGVSGTSSLIYTVCTGIKSSAQCNATGGTPLQNNPIISNTELDIDIDTIPDTNTVISTQPNQSSQIPLVTAGKKITHNLFSTLDKKSKIKGRKKKEFTKTNRSILKYTCTKIVNFD
jgi:hypothetical protein